LEILLGFNINGNQSSGGAAQVDWANIGLSSTPVPAVTSSQNPSLSGGAVTFTATLTGSPTPTGTVIFEDGTNTLATNALNSAGVASFSTASLSFSTNAPHSITAVYNGDSNYGTSTSTPLLQTNTAPVAITINNSGFESPALGSGGSYNTVTPSSWSGSSGSVGEYVPTTTQYPGGLPAADGSQLAYIGGTGSFYQTVGVNLVANETYILKLVVGQRNDNGFGIGTPYAQLIAGSTGQTPTSGITNVPAVGTLTSWFLTFTAPSSGGQVGQALEVLLGESGGTQANFDNVTLNAGMATTTGLTSSQNPSGAGGSVIFTATVNPPSGSTAPTNGTVTFYSNGTNTLGTGTLNSTNVATLTNSAFTTAGTYSITAAYGGSGNYGGSISSTLSQVIKTASTTTVSSSANPAPHGQAVIFTATVSGSGGTPTGTLQFMTNTVAFGSPVTLSLGATGTITNSALPHGTNTITAVYSGDSSFMSSTGSVSEVINTAPVAATLTVYRTAGTLLLVPLTNIASNWSDADGDIVKMTGVNTTSTNLQTLFLLNVTTNLDGSFATNSYSFIGYTNGPNVADQFSYSIADGYGGTNIGYVNISIVGTVYGTNSISSIVSGIPTALTAFGLPGYTYVTQRATNMPSPVWINISTNTAATNGVISVTDHFTDLGGVQPSSAYYRLSWSP
jgi:hypothetical protein